MLYLSKTVFPMIEKFYCTYSDYRNKIQRGPPRDSNKRGDYVENATRTKRHRRDMGKKAGNHQERDGRIAIEELLSQLYVDNVFSTFNNEEELKDFFLESRSIFNSAGLNLREWVSNSEILNQEFRNEGLGIDSSITKILGLEWDSEHDTITYPNKKLDDTACTKRTILSNLASLFDPCGILSPISIK
ncbi:hypothetical protein Avbf_15980, partial [Armadillidium vulgare]